MKIKKSQLKQLIKEELEATMDEGFLDRLMGRGSGDTLIYMPGQSIVELALRGDPPNRAEALVKLSSPKGSNSENRTISIAVDMYGDDHSKSLARVRQKVKNLNTDFMIADPNQPGGMDQIKAETLADMIYQDVRTMANQQDTDRFINKQDAGESGDPDAWIDYDEFTRGPNPARMVKRTKE